MARSRGASIYLPYTDCAGPDFFFFLAENRRKGLGFSSILFLIASYRNLWFCFHFFAFSFSSVRCLKLLLASVSLISCML